MELKVQHVTHIRKHLERTGRLVKWKKESQKRCHKRCNSTFDKEKMKLISSVEHRNNSVLLQVSSKEKVEHANLKENSNRFRLACTFLTLEGCLCYELGPLGKGPLLINFFTSQKQLQNRLEAIEIFELFRYSSYPSILLNVTTD